MRIGLETGSSLWHALAAPFQRLDDVSVRGWVVAVAAASWQWVVSDMFRGALAILILSGVSDYIVGVRAARAEGKYEPRLAHAGAMGKISGVALLLLVRLFEYWATQHAATNTKGAVATALVVSLIVVDLQSIAHHRERFGANPIPILSQVLGWIQSIAGSKGAK